MSVTSTAPSSVRSIRPISAREALPAAINSGKSNRIACFSGERSGDQLRPESRKFRSAKFRFSIRAATSNALFRSPRQIESCDARTAPLNQSPLISDVLPFGRSWYGEPNAVSNAINYAKFFSRSHDAVIRVCDEAGNVIETHEDAAISKSAARSKCLRLPRQSAILKRTLQRNNWAWRHDPKISM